MGKPEKIGAGILIHCEGEVLLLKRHPESGNGGTWGLPGGNQDKEDNGDLWCVASMIYIALMALIPPARAPLGTRPPSRRAHPPPILARPSLRRTTATREAREEVLNMPVDVISGPAPETSILTKRGKHLQKHFTVFVQHMDPKTVRLPALEFPRASTPFRMVLIASCILALHGL